MAIKTFIGSGYWHEKEKWTGGTLPTSFDEVVLDDKTISLKIGYDRKTLKYKLLLVLRFISFGTLNIPKYKLSYKSMLINCDNGELIILDKKNLLKINQ